MRLQPAQKLSLMGVMKQATGAFGGGLLLLAASVAIAALLALDWGWRRRATATP